MRELIREILKPHIPKIECYILNEMLDEIVDEVIDIYSDCNIPDRRNQIRCKLMQKFGEPNE